MYMNILKNMKKRNKGLLIGLLALIISLFVLLPLGLTYSYITFVGVIIGILLLPLFVISSFLSLLLVPAFAFLGLELVAVILIIIFVVASYPLLGWCIGKRLEKK